MKLSEVEPGLLHFIRPFNLSQNFLRAQRYKKLTFAATEENNQNQRTCQNVKIAK